MPYHQKQDRCQIEMVCLEQLVASDSPARIIDHFVDSLDLQKLGFLKATPAIEGRPSYPASDMLKLFVYGYRKTIRSSRKLEEACKLNIEMKWLICGLEPDYRTIADFRKDNINQMKKVFYEFVDYVVNALETGFLSIDGTKIQAYNSKYRNITAKLLDQKIASLKASVEEPGRFLAEMESQDRIEEELDPDRLYSKDEVDEKTNIAVKQAERMLRIRKKMTDEGLTQISLTDPDSRLMKTRHGYSVAYNVQTAVDSETHLIRDYNVTSRGNDYGLLAETAEGIKKDSPDEILDVVADKGYESAPDMVDCLEKGIVPNVISKNRKEGYELETVYEASEINEETRNSKKAEDLRKCLRAAVIPEAYKNILSNIEIVERRHLEKDCYEKGNNPDPDISHRDDNEMIKRAREGYFVRNFTRAYAYCPNGARMTVISKTAKGSMLYANKNACLTCPLKERCNKTKYTWRKVEFSKDSMEIPCRGLFEDKDNDRKGSGKKRHYVKQKIVKFVFTPDTEKMNKRKTLSEHPFGTIKRALDGYYFQLKRKFMVDGEFALLALGYNIKRSLSLLGFHKLMAVMG